MTDLDDIPFGPSTQRLALAHPRKWRHRHEWIATALTTSTYEGLPDAETICSICGIPKDDAASKRGRTSLRAGKDAERLVANDAGPEWKRVGQFGSPVDVEAPWAVGQVKAGSRYSVVDERDLEAMTAYSHGRTRLLFKVKRPGPGHQRRVQITMRLSQFMEEHGDVLVVLDMPDWKELHG